MNEMLTMLAVARGEKRADLVLTGGRIVNVFTGQIEPADIAISGRRIAGVGREYQGENQIDLQGAFISPGFIDAHVHIESSLCVPAQFAAAVVPRGVTTVVADPHEIANVAGADGVKFMAESAAGLHLDVVLMGPSCVPATSMAGAGANLSADDLHELRRSGVVYGLAEAMNFPAVIAGEETMLAKIAAMHGRPMDGHCPGVTGKALCAYVASGIGSDHESVIAAEAEEKLSRGLYLLIREATNARNLDALLKIITPANSRRICFCTDDRTPSHLLKDGSVDEMLRRAIAAGIEPIEAIRMVTLNTSEWFGLKDIGAIAPGRIANINVFDDLNSPRPRLVYFHGKLVAHDGKMLAAPPVPTKQPTLGRCEIRWNEICLRIKAKTDRIHVIGARPDQLITDQRILSVRRCEDQAVADVNSDVLKMAVINRHGAGGFRVAFISGFGLKRGAIAGTVAHDHHNLVTIGADDESMLTAAHAAAAHGGGLAVAVGNQLVAHLPLPVGGLMSDRPITEIAAAYDGLIAHANRLGSSLSDPFMAMSFMALEVIPSLKLTDRGLVDVEQFKLVDLFV
jgi:adenine deaminase